jgi:LCP family protein required for cell wall assembly
MGLFNKNKIKLEEEQEKTPVKFKRRKSRVDSLSNNNRKKKVKRAVITVIVLAILGVGGFFGFKAYNAIRNIFAGDSGILSLISGQGQPLKGESTGRVNVLLLGTGDKGHGGDSLSDTIMVVSYDVKSKSIAMISLPRDLYVQIPKHGYAKINAANAYGEQEKYPGGGTALAKETVENTLAVPIHYTVRVDFSGFRDIVDALGGVTVDVENSFCDYDYPVEYKGDTRTVCFTKGKQQMNGTKALQFSRSRHSIQNGEGSDFARAKRQQRLLIAIKDKALSNSTVFNPKKMFDIMNALGAHIKTDFGMADLVRLNELAKGVDTGKIINRNFDSSPEGLLVAESGAAGYILKPRTGNFKEIQTVVKGIFAMVMVKEEKAGIALYNGTWNTGLAGRLAEKMKTEGYNVLTSGDSDTKNITKTQIIDYTDGKKPETIKALEFKFGVKATKAESGTSSTSEIKIIVGKDYKES